MGVIGLLKGTTIAAVRKQGITAMAGDGQVTFGNAMIMKHQACKVRELYGGKVLAGFAGSVADAFTLFEKFESKLEEFRGNLTRAAVELAKEWRRDKILMKLEAMMIVADLQQILIISGNGEVIEPDQPYIAIGSGGAYAMAALKGLYHHSALPADSMAEEALKIAASLCVYTNEHITVKRIGG
ncbi:ATP-dependent HslUV protease, peptidase subunit HslV [Carboxydocella sporoproducens DSM 16521]|uniref:ATP-dependent protease subunit HslV n=2 Tax=Carboxydocella TaxID=178898 RepID=A0A1T4RK31_9FIRM|nr:ATP-dependent HslUV protease, peptidase subunit HslV [Carboxydocella thermautotrophica]SKA16031.1 ATP-dependent HslUV protease, peptidase subunit HslV [Carboxydocella sporoproducens DSM 16521]